jgi:diguanylate cyclase (GGDEF)-like protein
MDPTAAHPIAIVVPFHYAGAGIALFAAAVGMVGFRQQLYRTFVAVCLGLAMMQWTLAAYYQSTTLAEAGTAVRWQSFAYTLLAPLLYLFIAAYTKQRRVLPWFVVICVICTVLLTANFTSPFGLRFSDAEFAPPVQLPWGESVIMLQGQLNPWSYPARVMLLAIFIWAGWRAVLQYKAGERRLALLLGSYLVVQLATAIYGNLIDVGAIRSVYVIGFGFLLLTLVMGVSLAVELNDRTNTLTQTVVDLDNSNRQLSEAKESIHKLAYFDAVTGLPNRFPGLEHTGRVYAEALASGRHGALLLFDLDHFRVINDSLGHQFGDKVLAEVGSRLAATVRDRAALFHVSGDGFIIVFEGQGADSDAVRKLSGALADDILGCLRPPMQIGEHRLHVGASIGISLFPQEGAAPYDIFRQAEIAMYRAKDQGRNIVRVFQPEMRRAVEQRLELDRRLRGALDNREFTLVFQPQVDEAGNMTGTEALLRWHNMELGLVPPVLFIPVAEETGLIRRIGEWVLNEACARVHDWNEHGIAFGAYLAVNVSPWQLADPGFVDEVRSILATHAVDPRQLMLEVTESSLLFDLEACVVKLSELRALGVGVALDDFGTGYSSLSHLQELPLDVLKIDKSFVYRLRGGSRPALVSGIIAIGNLMGMKVVAEGVETSEQRDSLLQMGCSRYQGYLISRPLAEDAFLDWLSARQPVASSKAAD